MIAVFSELGQRSVLKDDAVFTVVKFVDPLDGRKFVIPCLAFNICEFGLALFDPDIDDALTDTINRADKAMYDYKAKVKAKKS